MVYTKSDKCGKYQLYSAKPLRSVESTNTESWVKVDI